jgi:hypothetical protein
LQVCTRCLFRCCLIDSLCVYDTEAQRGRARTRHQTIFARSFGRYMSTPIEPINYAKKMTIKKKMGNERQISRIISLCAWPMSSWSGIQASGREALASCNVKKRRKTSVVCRTNLQIWRPLGWLYRYSDCEIELETPIKFIYLALVPPTEGGRQGQKDSCDFFSTFGWLNRSTNMRYSAQGKNYMRHWTLV